MSSDVLIAGAGPTGLVLALWLTKQGVKVRIVDKAQAPAQASRALAVQARTLELYRQLGIADEVVARGHKVPAVNLWVKGAPKARIRFEVIGEGLTPYPFLLTFPQDAHEKLLADRLSSLGVAVERGLELAGFAETDGGVRAELRSADGQSQTCEALFICGCDGARSIVRKAIGATFPGGDYRQLFYVADVHASGLAANGELHIDLDEADFLAVFPISDDGRVRLVGTVRDEPREGVEGLEFKDVSTRAIDNLKVKVEAVNWFSTYRVHHRVADRFRQGRAFILGDAAHIHSPAGGQGMNTGIGDAINLAWKLAAVVKGGAPDRLLDSFAAERMPFARRLVATTDRVFTFVTAEGAVADLLRTRLAPLIMPRAAAIEPVREYIFRTVSQITLNYRGSPLSQGSAGKVHGGDRLPWARADGADNFGPPGTIGWQAHVYGAAQGGLRAWCETRRLPLHVFPYAPAHEAAGLARDAAYLVRPDAYVALATPDPPAEAMTRYFETLGLQ